MQKSSKTNQNNRIRSERLQKILNIEHLGQNDLAGMMDMEPQNLSRDIRNGKLSEKTCKRILTVLPEGKYSIQWLLGFSPYMNEQEEFDAFFRESDRYTDMVFSTVKFLSNLKNITVTLYSEGFLHADGSIQNDYKIRTGTRTGYVSFSTLSNLVADLAALTESRLTREMSDTTRNLEKEIIITEQEES